MSKQWWSSRSMVVAQTGCLLALIAWSVRHAPAETGHTGKPAPAAEPDAVIDNSEDTAEDDSAGSVDARFVAPPRVHFRTENPPAGTMNLRPVDGGSSPQHAAPWQPVHPQNPPQRLPSGPRSPFEDNGKGATVYNAPPPDEE